MTRSLARRALVASAAALLVLLGGCSGAGVGRRDAAADATRDLGADATLDLGVDGAQDSGALTRDASEDAPVDGSADAGSDASTGTAAACGTAGAGGHLQMVSAYWAATDVFGDDLAELTPALQVGHVDLARLGRPLPPGIDVIVDLHWELFDYATHTVRADLSARLDAIAAAAAPVLPRIRAFYLVDEPYVAGHAIPRGELEAAIAAVEARFPGVPTYITFAHHCFDPVSTDVACVVPSSQRGIPSGLDWVGFDWYNDSNDLSVAAGHVPAHIATGVARIAALAPLARIIVVPETYTDATRLESTVVSTLHDYFALAAGDPSVFGVDFFLWADAPAPENFRGLHSLPSARSSARAFARWVRRECGEVASLIPVTQWYSPTAPDYRYEPWVWDGRPSGYRVDGVAFALAPIGTPGTVPLIHCLVDRGTSVDSYLTRDPGCDGAAVVTPGVVIGGIYTTAQPGTVELHRYGLTRPPWDNAYALTATATLPPGYTYSFPIGWVFPPSAL